MSTSTSTRTRSAILRTAHPFCASPRFQVVLSSCTTTSSHQKLEVGRTTGKSCFSFLASLHHLACFEHGHKYCAELHLYHPQSQDTTMEPSYSATGTASNICWRSLIKGSRIEQLLRLYRWDCPANLQREDQRVNAFSESSPSPSHVRVRVRSSHKSAVYLFSVRPRGLRPSEWRVVSANFFKSYVYIQWVYNDHICVSTVLFT